MRESRPAALSAPRALLWRALRLLGELSLLATVFVLLARWWWFFDLFANFRIQLFVVQLLLLAAYLAMRRPLWAVAIGLACVINGIAIRDYVLPGGHYVPDSELSAQIRLLNANVRSSNATPERLLDVIDAVEPDVIAVLELTDAVANALEPLGEYYPHQVLVPESGNFGIGVYSRWPFADSEVLEFGGIAAIDAEILHNAGNWHFIAAHTVPPISADMAGMRNRQLDELADRVSTATAPVIVVGDFNLAPHSPWFAQFTATTGLSDSLRGRGPAYTWPSFFMPLGITIDHVLVSNEFEVVDRFRAGDIGSDHFPVIVDVNRNEIGLD